MIHSIKIKNFKSIEKLKLDLGRVNIIIGANGSGKSNILEAIAMAAASIIHKLDNEFLSSRGIRITEPSLMRAAFQKENSIKPIEVSFRDSKKIEYDIEMTNKNTLYSNWELNTNKYNLVINPILDVLLSQEPDQIKGLALAKRREILDQLLRSKYTIADKNFSDFITYSPENNKIRNFHTETQIEPLGIYGEGLFKLLSVMKPAEIEEIKKNLKLIDWFEDIEIPTNNFPGERKVIVKDKYIHEELRNFDQRSTNEGFLFLLFYLAAIISEHTPQFFAIDNIDNSLNPSLCSSLVKILTDLARKYDKQIILTTHNPAVLDGLNLNNEDEKLFVVSRNAEGRTKIKSVSKPKVNGKEPVKLSEAFLRGYIGGLNKSQF